MPPVSVLDQPILPPRRKVIIDTDPGIDDAIAILLAFESPELDIIGLTTTYGNVRTEMATYNALHLGEAKERIADFVHGSDGLGNTGPLPPRRSAITQSAAEFLAQKCKELPGQVTIVALGPLTNIAKALEDDPTFAKNVGQIIILGGAFMVNGNVNPAAEANVFGDPIAADLVLTCGADIIVIGINITHQVFFTDKDMEEVRESGGRYADYVYKASRFYFDYHHDAYDIDAIYLHDPTTVVAAIDPSLFTYSSGVVRVQTEGICRGLTVFNNTSKKWAEPTAWCSLPPVKVAVTVNASAVSKIVKDRLMDRHLKLKV